MSVEVDLSGRVAVVTGGGDGIGGAVSARLASAGAHVVIVEIDADRARERVDRITDAGGHAEAVVADVTDAAQLDTAVERALAAADGRVDVLVNNVGHYLRATPLLQSGDAHWAALHDINVLHIFRCCRAFVPGMVERGAGSVINVSSVEALRGYPPDPVYGAYKAAVAHFTRCFALEVAPSGVRVNAIGPDVTQTSQVDYEAMVPEELRDRWPVWVPVGRVGTPEDQADVVLFLASDLSRFVTGHVIPTEGGTLAAGGWFRTRERGRWTNRPRDP
jgi:NAD(P)-dependent dehydrogenase (short-subunit alcohol dehydrogenase family)